MVTQTIKNGYKQAEAGIFPEDWKEFTLGEITTEIRDGTHQTPTYVSHGVPFYSVENITAGDFVNSKFISETEHKLLTRKFKIEKGDILMTRIGSVGDCKVIDWDVDASFYVSLALLKIKKEFSPEFISQYSKTNSFRIELEKRILLWAVPKKINLNDISKIKIYIPDKDEQEKIAEVLSDTDNLINKLETLIQKKKNIKQGAMQELLTGKRRLKGFSGKWETKKLGKLAQMSSGGTPLTSVSSYYGGNIPWVVIADITSAGKYLNHTEKNITEKGLQNSSAKKFKEGTLLFAMYASIGKCCIAKTDLSCNQAILGIETEKIDTEFLYYNLVFSEKKFSHMGQTGTQNNLNKEIVQNLDILHPSDIEEQEAISQILSAMDLETEQLEKKKEKYKMIKQGMMQKLLTGEIRLQ